VTQGRQLVFRTPLAAGTLVFEETPFVADTVPDTHPYQHHTRHNDRFTWNLVEECYKTLSRGQIDAILGSGYASGVIDLTAPWETPADDLVMQSIAGRHQEADASRVRRLFDVIGTNCLLVSIKPRTFLMPDGTRLDVTLPCYGFFLLLSRANHACVPSTRLAHFQGGRVQVITTRAVAAGESLTIDYINTIPLEAKRTRLFEGFGFRCACDRCRRLCSLLECNAPGTKACPCHQAQYCSVDHQRADWKRHKELSH
jgi:hypothetical protein